MRAFGTGRFGFVLQLKRAFALIALTGLSACSTVVPATPAPARPAAQAARPAPRPMPPRPVQPRPTQPLPVVQRPVPTEAPAALQGAIRSLGASFDGSVGIAVRDIHAGWVVDYNGRQPMPQQSVSKLWVAMTLLEGVDQGRISLSEMVRITRDDLTLFHQPISQLVGQDGYQESVSSLLARAMTQSDNTANDSLLRRAGGPAAVRSFLTSHGITDIRFGPGERLLQSGTAGLTWKQEYSRGNAFYTARANLPMSVRQDALARYLADPPDGATAIGMVNALAKLKRGELLSSRSTDYLITTMRASRTGPNRLRGGVSAGWLFGHKTGTGQQLGGTSTGYNDVGLLTAPDGRTYAVAVMIGSTRRSIPERMSLMQAVTRAVISSHWARPATAD
ncbi:serine hydrolase [Sphingomonas sp. LaA6.9]|uniref:serine hydrolase n=1 Tax=Sphingomonas sp. LaA6.9 TaxID=2919914 RepID=UPI00387EE7BC